MWGGEVKNYVIMRGSEKGTDLYGKVLRIDAIDESKMDRVKIIDSISKWEDIDCLPKLVDDPLMIEVLECLDYRDRLNDKEIESYKSDIRDAIDSLERLL